MRDAVGGSDAEDDLGGFRGLSSARDSAEMQSRSEFGLRQSLYHLAANAQPLTSIIDDPYSSEHPPSTKFPPPQLRSVT